MLCTLPLENQRKCQQSGSILTIPIGPVVHSAHKYEQYPCYLQLHIRIRWYIQFLIIMKFIFTIFLALASVAQGWNPDRHVHYHKHHKTITGSTTEPPQVTVAPRGTTTSFSYSGPAGSRGYNVYTPAGYSRDSPVPLIVVLHGCTQSPSIIAANSNFGALADEKQFVLAFPSETEADNFGACWDWYGLRSADQSRGSGKCSFQLASPS